jgi:signal transduction histidine kinase
MEPSFVSEKLFMPLSSEKPDGFGLGAFQVRQLVRGMGGKLEVDTAPGAGTVMRVRLPVLRSKQRIGNGYEE